MPGLPCPPPHWILSAQVHDGVHIMNKLKSARVRDYMVSRLVLLDPDMEIVRATNLLIRNDISGAPVVDHEGRLVGILTERDCMRVAVEAEYHAMPGGLVRDVMSVNPQFVGPDDNIFQLARRFIDHKYRRYPVVENGRIIGLISRRDVMRALENFYPT
jgi:CBS domain-containing protein